MTDAVVRRESASEYFKELVEGALAHQRIAAGELTSFYVVNLLTGFLQRPAEEGRRHGSIEQHSQPVRMGDLADARHIEHVSMRIAGRFEIDVRLLVRARLRRQPLGVALDPPNDGTEIGRQNEYAWIHSARTVLVSTCRWGRQATSGTQKPLSPAAGKAGHEFAV